MKTKILCFLAILIVGCLIFTSCQPINIYPNSPSVTEDTESPGSLIRIKEGWDDLGNLKFMKLDGTVIMKLDGNNGDVEITNLTATTTGSSGSLIPATTLTYDIGSSSKVWRSVYLGNNVTIGTYKMTFPSSAQTLVGLTTSDTLTNKTLTSPTINGGTIASLTSIVSTSANFTNLGMGGVSITFPTSGLLVGRTDTQTLTNKTLTSPTINGGTIASLTSIFSTSANFTSLRVNGVDLTFPASGLVVGTTDSQVLTNKTLTAPIITSISNNGTITFTGSASYTVTGNTLVQTLTNKTLSSPAFTGTGTGTWTLTNLVSSNVSFTGGSATGLTAISSTSANFSTLGTVSGVLVITASSGAIATLTGTTSTYTNARASTANFTTIGTYSGSLTITSATLNSATLASPIITGTQVSANQQSGSANFTASATTLYIAHGLSGTPTRVFFSFGGNPGISSNSSGINFFTWSANSTNITITSVTATNTTAMCYWIAYIADE